jgi:hypothetical protein
VDYCPGVQAGARSKRSRKKVESSTDILIRQGLSQRLVDCGVDRGSRSQVKSSAFNRLMVGLGTHPFRQSSRFGFGGRFYYRHCASTILRRLEMLQIPPRRSRSQCWPGIHRKAVGFDRQLRHQGTHGEQLRSRGGRMKVLVLAWGSLVWDPGALRLASNWMEGGPVLPIEFSRISDDGRLTLVIDERHGVEEPPFRYLKP